MDPFFDTDSRRFHCPGCGRLIDGSELREGERVKCAKCKKLMRFGPRLFEPSTRTNWQVGRLVLLVACIAATIWCVTVGYGFGSRTGRWVSGFGGAVLVWMVAVGCIALAARTTQNNGVLVGVAATMVGVSLLFMERLGERVGYDVASWHEFRLYDVWVPGLIGAGLAVFVVALVIQGRSRPV